MIATGQVLPLNTSKRTRMCWLQVMSFPEPYCSMQLVTISSVRKADVAEKQKDRQDTEILCNIGFRWVSPSIQPSGTISQVC